MVGWKRCRVNNNIQKGRERVFQQSTSLPSRDLHSDSVGVFSRGNGIRLVLLRMLRQKFGRS